LTYTVIKLNLIDTLSFILRENQRNFWWHTWRNIQDRRKWWCFSIVR